MGSRRTMLVLIGVGVAVLAGAIAWFYVSRADERAEEKVETIDVVRAVEDIPRGTTGAEAIEGGLVDLAPELEEQAPPDSLTSFEALTDTVADAEISQGQIITSRTFVAPTQLTTEGGPLADRLRTDSEDLGEPRHAVSFTATNERGVAGLLTVGDTVNVMVVLDGATRYVLADMTILAVGTSTGDVLDLDTETDEHAQPQQPVQTNTGLITVEGSASQAAKIAQAQVGPGEIYLSLAPSDYDPGEEAPPLSDLTVDDGNLFN